MTILFLFFVEAIALGFGCLIYAQSGGSMAGLLGAVYAFGLLSLMGIYMQFPRGTPSKAFGYRPFSSWSLSRGQIVLFLAWFLGFGAVLVYLAEFGGGY